MSTQTVHFGSNATEYALSGAPDESGNTVSFSLTASSTVTAESVLAAVKDAGSYVVTTDGTAGEAHEGYVLSGNVGIDSSTGNIVFALRKKSTDEIAKEQMQTQIDALGAQVAALSMGGVS